MSDQSGNMVHIKEGFRWLFGDSIMLRGRADWMTGSDDVILEFLKDSGAGHNFQGIANNFEDRGVSISYKTVTRRVPKLEQVGLVRILPGDGKYYIITERGEAYLRGELDLSDEPAPE